MHVVAPPAQQCRLRVWRDPASRRLGSRAGGCRGPVLRRWLPRSDWLSAPPAHDVAEHGSAHHERRRYRATAATTRQRLRLHISLCAGRLAPLPVAAPARLSASAMPLRRPGRCTTLYSAQCVCSQMSPRVARELIVYNVDLGLWSTRATECPRCRWTRQCRVLATRALSSRSDVAHLVIAA